ncbi:MAG: LysR family transcriptional regulator [Pseudomonadota bacterium]
MMIEYLKSMAIFASVVEVGSFRGAASRLGLSPSVVSDHVSHLERELGVALLYRSTRSLSLTENGERLYPQASALVRNARQGLDQFSDVADAKLTKLRVAIPATMNCHPIVNRIASFARSHPGTLIHLHSSDRQADLQREGFDVAVRMGFFKDSDLKTRRIGNEHRLIVAAPAYLAEHDSIQTPSDLRKHSFVSFSLVPDRIELKCAGKRRVEVWGETVVVADSAETARELAAAGLGIAALPFHSVQADIEAGRLRQVLPDWEEKTLPINLTWPKNATLNPLTRKFIDYLRVDKPSHE